MANNTISKKHAPKCAVCSTRIQTLPTDRVIATAKDGKVVYTHFCGPSCESAYHT